MNNPKDELREYLKKLVRCYINIKSIHQERNSILEWMTPDKIETINRGIHFFYVATYSMSNTVLVELSKFLSENEKRSLLDWLKKTKEHAKSMQPTRHNVTSFTGRRESIKPKEYCAIIDEQIAQLHARKNVIKRIKAHRDKAIAYLDKTYFEDSEALARDYPLGINDIDELLEVVDSILRKHYSCLFEADMRMEVLSAYNVNKILRDVRASRRVWNDRNLIKKGIAPRDYWRDD
jgi:hypothetical protein